VFRFDTSTLLRHVNLLCYKLTVSSYKRNKINTVEVKDDLIDLKKK